MRNCHIVFSGLTFLLICILNSACQKNAETQTLTIRDTIKIIQSPNLDRPIYFSATKGFYGKQITLSWTSIPLAKKYQIYRFDISNNEYRLLKEQSDTLYADMNITQSLTKYFYKVRVFNDSSNYSPFSDIDYGYTSGKNYYTALSFGKQGKGIADFDFPTHIETDQNNNLYISDDGNNKVLKFDIKGNYIEQFYSGLGARGIGFFKNGNYVATRVQSTSYVQIFNSTKQLIKEWGTYGSGDNNFANVEELAIDDDQNIWIVDGINDRIKKYDTNGNLLLIIGSTGNGAGQFQSPIGVCYFDGNIYTTDHTNQNIQVFSNSGKYIKTLSLKYSFNAIKAKDNFLYIASENFIIKTDLNGDVVEKIGEGSFQYVTGVALGINDEVIGLDFYGRKVVVFKKG